MQDRSLWVDGLLVAAGAVAGAVARFAVSTWIPTKGFPWATLLVNLAGAFAIGFLLLAGPVEPGLRLWAVVGFLGSFTTLSAYAFETVDLWRAGRTDLALANAVANGVGGPLVAAAGWFVRSKL